ncbi:MAG: RNA polymerase subunit sigma-70, partial [Clostridia bacterium]|nr:RNA polymerase subunit sigma-70 [Clostridia bacterium]
MDDSRIVDLYLARDEMAVEYSANKYGDRLKKLAYGIVCDRLTAEECESDTYMESWRRIPPHEPRDY